MTSISWKGVTGDWTTAADWSTGTVPGSADAAGITAAGSYVVGIAAAEQVAARSAVLNAAAATLRIDGTLALGTTLALQAGTLLLDGTIAGGTIAATGGSAVFAGGTLSATTWRGGLALGADGTLNVAGGLRVTSATGGRGTIDLTGTGAAVLNITDSETLNAVTIIVGSATGSDELAANGPSLTLGSGVTLTSVGVNGLLLDGAASVTNLGRIVAGFAGGSASIATGSFANGGTIAVSNGQTLSISPQDGVLTNTGLISVASGGSLGVSGDVTGAGRLALVGNGTMELSASVAAEQSVTFSGTGGVLILDDAGAVAGTIKGFASGDRIDVLGLSPIGGAVAFAGGIATLSGGLDASLAFSGSFAGRGFSLVSDGNGSAFLITGRAITGPAGGHATISQTTGNAIVTAQGAFNTITVGNGDAVIAAGTGGANVSTGNGNVVLILAGSGNLASLGNGADIVTGSANFSLVQLGDGPDQVTLTGSFDAVRTGNGASTISLTGNYDAVLAGTGANQITVSGTHDVVATSGGGSAISASGSGDFVFLGTGSSTVSDLGAALSVVAGPGAGASVLQGVASDPSFVLDLVGGVGGYASAEAAFAALVDDGHGGSLLTLGGGSIDFAGVAPTQLTAHNFAVVQHMNA